MSLKKAVQHLRTFDPPMGALIDQIGKIDIKPAGEPFRSLVVSIISQLVSAKAADTVYDRLKTRIDNNFTPEALLSLTQKEFQTCGIGAQKYSYLIHLSERFLESPDFFHHLDRHEDGEVIQQLTSLKGIGKWTAQMFLIFSLARPDVFAPDDVGLQKAMRLLYELPDSTTKKEYISLSEKWAPYRSIASRYLWKSLHVLEGRTGVRN